MAKAGNALRQTLEKYGISQNRLAVTMGIARSTVNQWVHETCDPLAEAVTEIIKALRQIDEAAAADFIDLYLERNSRNDDEGTTLLGHGVTIYWHGEQCVFLAVPLLPTIDDGKLPEIGWFGEGKRFALRDS